MLTSEILSSLSGDYKYFVTAWDSTPASEKALGNLKSLLLAEKKTRKLMKKK